MNIVKVNRHCVKCESSSFSVTTKGREESELYDGDLAACDKCGASGVVETDGSSFYIKQ